MGDDDGRVGGWGWAVVVIVAVLAAARPAAAQRLHGQAAVEYQNLDPAGATPLRETWIKTFQTDYSRGLPGAVEFSSRFRFSEQTIVGKADRLRSPEGSVRLAHRSFGVSAAYLPSAIRDARSITTRQQTLSLTGYAQKPGLPRVAGSWIRNHLDANAQSPASATVARSLSAVHTLPHVGFRAAYGDRLLEGPSGLGARVSEKHYNLGSSSNFHIARAPVSLQYDFSRAHANPTGLRSLITRTHTAVGSSSLQLGAKTTSSLGYTYRRTESEGPGATTLGEHNGALTLSYAPRPMLQVATSAGLRSATFAGRSETERFVSASASAQGEAREGWRLAASVSHALNWLPGETVRIADNFQSSTSMRLARGLEMRGDVGISAGRRPPVAPDSGAGPRDVAFQTGAGLTANPLRTVAMDASAYRTHVGGSLLRGGVSSVSYSSRLRLTPYARLQMSGGWNLSRGATTEGTTLQTTLQWTLTTSLQASGSYSRSRQEVSGAAGPLVSRQQSRSGTLVVSLGRQLNGSIRYSESNWREAAHVRQVSASMVRNFGS
jgi:hypothetical protein